MPSYYMSITSIDAPGAYAGDSAGTFIYSFNVQGEGVDAGGSPIIADWCGDLTALLAGEVDELEIGVNLFRDAGAPIPDTTDTGYVVVSVIDTGGPGLSAAHSGGFSTRTAEIVARGHNGELTYSMVMRLYTVLSDRHALTV